ncbi:MAG: hypothetical protein QOF00_4098 [Pseudonocardiales bacterium]|jgi:2-polyprenyl-6-methoxyphenol hydroxylase-like FAD-dependent oxidoreductase|nr:hypothetical protein [Pseudonocardiales bacterium]
MDTTVLIVGSGPTGLVLACDLARRGVDLRIVEKSPDFPRSSRAKGPNARSLEVLADLDVLAAATAAGASPPVMRKYWEGAWVVDSDPSVSRGLMIAQYRLEEILRERLAGFGAHVELDTEVVGITQDDDGVTARLADGRSITASWLVGCDGGHSAVRKLVGARFDGTSHPKQVMVCGDVEMDGPDRGVWHQWFDAEGGVMLCPIPGTARSWWFQAGPEHDADGGVVEPTREGFQRLLDRHARVPGLTVAATALLSTYRVNARMVDRYRFGRVFLAGDAAHVHPIAGGLGMDTGIQDAFNLGWKLGTVATGEAGPALLDTYEEERLPIAAWTLEISSERLRDALDAVARPGGGLDVVVTKDTTGLGVGYPWSSLAGSGPQAGMRVPDALSLDAVGRFSLLGFGACAPHALHATAQRWSGPLQIRTMDPADGRAYGIDGDALVLVRPDGHIALTAPDAGPVLAYLADVITSSGRDVSRMRTSPQ